MRAYVRVWRVCINVRVDVRRYVCTCMRESAHVCEYVCMRAYVSAHACVCSVMLGVHCTFMSFKKLQ